MTNRPKSPIKQDGEIQALRDEAELLTTLKAAANYICRASSDHYDANTRDIIIKSLTYWIGVREAAATTPPSTPAKATAERAAAEMGAPLDKTQTGSSVFLQIPTCGRCPFVDHSGSFTPGGAKTICNHRDAVETFAANVEGEDRYHWKYRQVNHDAAPPEQCPLRVLTVR